ncbi:MAG TPA: M20/M25/M40 family metallo-hydrolase, partial [Thermoanaerobaculaceae bacterium]|nr:M20/M25/M40 family metallo-hydrolase [Thermoanaerobaculaceae bacterium]
MQGLIALVGLAATITLASPAAAQTTRPSPADDFSTAAPAQPLPEPAETALATIKAPALGAHIALLASPALEGRGLTSHGLDAAAEYVAASLTLAGIPPLPSADKESYFQPFAMREIRDLSGRITVESRPGNAVRSRDFLSGVDCLLPTLPPQVIAAPAVFAGFGLREPALGHDDLKGMDVRGKVVLILDGVPSGSQWQTPELVDRYGSLKVRERVAAKLQSLRPLAPAAVLVVADSDLLLRALREDPPESYQFRSVDTVPDADDEPIWALVSPALAEALLAPAGPRSGSTATTAPRDLPGTTATIRVSGNERLAWSRNVVGFLAGSDPTLRDEAVVIGAHMDHLGRVGDVIYPGADDNASGVASLLEIAKAFAACEPKPKRTVIFAFWAGEEEGKLGSGHWVRHPSWPLVKTTAYLNLDMVGHPWSTEEIRALVADTKLPNGEAFVTGLRSADFIEPGVAE